MGTEESPVRITAEEEIQAPLNQLPPNTEIFERGFCPGIAVDLLQCFPANCL